MSVSRRKIITFLAAVSGRQSISIIYRSRHIHAVPSYTVHIIHIGSKTHAVREDCDYDGVLTRQFFCTRVSYFM